jgi:hypothetical protein
MTAREDRQRAAFLYTESAALFRTNGDTNGVCKSLILLGSVMLEVGKFSEARSHYKECLAISQELVTGNNDVECVLGLGILAGKQGSPAKAATLVSVAETFMRASLDRDYLAVTDGFTFRKWIAEAHVEFGGPEFAAAWAEGQALTLEKAVTYALED